MSKKDKVILVDGSSYFFRAFFAIQHLTNSKGFPTNAVFGFIQMLLKVLEVEKPKKLAICFDTAKPSFRKKIYDEYKANRDSAPEDLVLQIPWILKVVDAFGIYQIQKEGFEADDLIGTMAEHASAEGHKVDIISGDKDLMQLVNKKVCLFDTMRDKRYDEKGVEEKFEVRPDQMVDFLALMGDASDNIPGVAGVGKKTAAELLKEYGSLDGLYKKVENIKQKKRREKLIESKDMAYLSQKLVQLDLNVEIDYTLEDLNYDGPILEKLQPILEEMEFHSLLKRFNLKKNDTDEFKPGAYDCILKEADLKKAVAEIKEAGQLCLDTETTSLNIQDAVLVGVSLSWKDAQAVYIPIGHQTAESAQVIKQQLEPELVKKYLKPILEDAKIGKVGQNLKYDMQILKRWGVELKGIEADTLVMSYLIDPDQKHGLDAQAMRQFGHQNISFESVVGKGKSQVTFDEVPIEKASDYAAEDADVTYRLFNKLKNNIEEFGLSELYEEVEIPLVSVLAQMEYTGISVDVSKLKKMSKSLETELLKLEESIFKQAGEKFNINSPKQLGEILFTKMKLPPVRKTKTGFSTDERVLRTLSKKHAIADKLLKFREYGKLRSTYVEGLLGQVHPETKRIHTQFNQTVAATGRLSSSNPNLQNIPIGEHTDYDIRSVFIPSQGMEFFCADYSQVELRLLAHMSEDPELMRAFENDEDVHAYTGKLIFDVDEVSSEQRKIAKTINFGVIYGQTPFGLSQQLGISTYEAKDFIDSYFDRYSGVSAFMESTLDEAREEGLVRTLLGRRRFIPEINTKNRMRREMAERTATNTPLQGTAADMIKKAMVEVQKRLEKEKLKSRLLLQVHDELVLEVPDGEKVKVENLVVEEMEGALALKVPLKVDSGWGANWRECK